MRFDIDAAGLSPARGKVSLPKSAKNMPANGGFEAIAVLRGGPYKGKLVAFSERMRDDDGNHIGWIWQGEERPRKFYLTNDGDYDVTDAAPLPDGGAAGAGAALPLERGRQHAPAADQAAAAAPARR